MRTIGETFGADRVWSGNIFTRVYATDPAHGRPLLVPYDLFRYVPWSDKILSRTQVPQFNRLLIERGCLFIVCSGRNLGPVTIADAFCERFAMSHDMVRIDAGLSPALFYVAAFLSTRHGQAAIRTDMNGSVIDHTNEKQVAALSYPVVNDSLRAFCAEQFRLAFERREQARLRLALTQEDFLEYFGLLDLESESVQESLQRRFVVKRSHLGDRIDAEPHAPRYNALRKAVRAVGGCELSEIATVTKPYGRYKTNYVADERYGIWTMNGRQISQYQPIALKRMSLSAFDDPDSFRLTAGTTLVTADGRAEENLADCALTTPDRDGWAASGHVHRVRPRDGVHPGMVYLACSCAPSQAQMKALATGSVVDALSTADLESVVVPYSGAADATRLGERASAAWGLFAEASEAEAQAVNALEQELSRLA